MSEPDRAGAKARGQGRRDDFGAALRRAEARRGEAGGAEARRAAGRGEEQATARRGAEARGAKEGPGAEPQSGREGGREVGERAAGGGGGGGPADAGAATPALAPLAAAGSGAAGLVVTHAEAGHAELIRAVRALPPVVEAFQAAGQPALSLELGGALGVELRRGAGGVELRLSASPALLPAARAELASLCRSLVARGVAVASAEVRGRGGRWSRP